MLYRENVRILVVEDDSNLRELWGQVLRPYSRISYASTVTEALSEIKNKQDPPDILILDWILGRSSADVVLDTWVEEIAGPACVISGNLDLAQRYALYPKGVYNSLGKPVELETFVAIIRNYIKFVKTEKALFMLSLEVTKLKRYILILGALLIATSTGSGPIEKVVAMLVGLF